jgi:hypothetical protein
MKISSCNPPKPILMLSAVLLLLSACQPGALPRPGDTMHEQLSEGQFMLHHEVSIAAGRVRIVFQEGRVSYGSSEYRPRCELEVRDILKTAQIIPAGSYRIVKVLGMQRYVNRPPGGIMLADAGEPIRFADGTINAWSMYTYRMQLLHEQQPGAPTLVCGGAYNTPFNVRYPTLREMQGALGDHATLTLK